MTLGWMLCRVVWKLLSMLDRFRYIVPMVVTGKPGTFWHKNGLCVHPESTQSIFNNAAMGTGLGSVTIVMWKEHLLSA